MEVQINNAFQVRLSLPAVKTLLRAFLRSMLAGVSSNLNVRFATRPGSSNSLNKIGHCAGAFSNGLG